MKITFLGDSIREQYAPRVKDLLGNDFEIWYPSENCRFSKYTLRGLFEWADAMAGSDIVHWNNGLWDICDLWGDGTFSSETEYIDNMMRILDILQKKHKTIIFATTTPVRKENQYDRNEDIDRFNRIIVPKLQDRGVIINDLSASVKSDIYRYICDDTIHLSKEGIDLCAKQVAQCIKEAAKNMDDTKMQKSNLENDKKAPDKKGLPVLI